MRVPYFAKPPYTSIMASLLIMEYLTEYTRNILDSGS